VRRGLPSVRSACNMKNSTLWIVVGASLAARMNARVERLWKAQGTRALWSSIWVFGNRLDEVLIGIP
jgi:hypothetical protein